MNEYSFVSSQFGIFQSEKVELDEHKGVHTRLLQLIGITIIEKEMKRRERKKNSFE